MAKPYRWGDPTPEAVVQQRARRAQRAQDAYWMRVSAVSGAAQDLASAHHLEAAVVSNVAGVSSKSVLAQAGDPLRRAGEGSHFGEPGELVQLPGPAVGIDDVNHGSAFGLEHGGLS